MRYVRAFGVALWMTLRGEQPKPTLVTKLREWMRQTEPLIDAVYQAADQNGIDYAARKAFVLRLDGRPMNMETVLSTVRYHVSTEYLHLLRENEEHAYTAIFASNFNDQYRIARLAQSIEKPTVQNTLEALRLHLERIPSNQQQPS